MLPQEETEKPPIKAQKLEGDALGRFRNAKPNKDKYYFDGLVLIGSTFRTSEMGRLRLAETFEAAINNGVTLDGNRFRICNPVVTFRDNVTRIIVAELDGQWPEPASS